jgi:AcrR family transcriptional regulator
VLSSSHPQTAGLVDRPAKTTLREQKRAVVRQAISAAALRLALERGLEGVLVPEIAAEAGVSPRTFNNYFSSKEEAVVAQGFDRMERILVAFRERPADEPLWASVTEAILSQFPEDRGVVDIEVSRRARLVAGSPALWAEQLKTHGTIERLMADTIAERLESPGDHELLPRLVAMAAIGASRVAFDHWVDSDGDVPFRHVLEEALDRFRSAFVDLSADVLT